ncbi:MAG: HAD family hydrolase [Christensenellaceae bacterium]|nr:HAD family hydrolase [Christensenellaceae bacterium]
MNKETTAVFFDVDDTLYDLAWPFHMAVHDMFQGRYDDSIDNIFIRSRFHTDARFEEFSDGRLSPEDFHAYRHQMAFSDCGIQITREEALELLSVYRSYQDSIKMTRTVKDMLVRLDKKGVLTGILSNGVSAPQWKKIRILKIPDYIPEERIIVSGDVGYAKPHREIFDYAVNQLGLTGDDIWYVGDNHKVDIAGAKAAGWKTVWMNKRHHTLPPEGPEPEYTVTDEAELSELLLRIL